MLLDPAAKKSSERCTTARSPVRSRRPCAESFCVFHLCYLGLGLSHRGATPRCCANICPLKVDGTIGPSGPRCHGNRTGHLSVRASYDTDRSTIHATGRTAALNIRGGPVPRFLRAAARGRDPNSMFTCSEYDSLQPREEDVYKTRLSTLRIKSTRIWAVAVWKLFSSLFGTRACAAGLIHRHDLGMPAEPPPPPPSFPFLPFPSLPAYVNPNALEMK